MKESVVTITLGFAPSRIWRQSIAAYAKTRNPDLGYRHFFLNQHYPLNKAQNEKENREICDQYGVEYLDAGRNIGLHNGFNYALKAINPGPGSIVIAYDPDTNPISPGWDMALVRAIRGDPKQKVVWASLLHEAARLEVAQRGFESRKADGYIEMRIPRGPVMNSICAWSVDWLLSVGMLIEPNDWYGHLESAMWNKLNGKQWAFLPGWTENEEFRSQQDEEYKIYKWELAHKGSTTLDFESWLKTATF